MSFIRCGHDLRDFEGESELYVFHYEDGFGNTWIEDYDATYEDNASFAQLLLNISRRVIDDKDYIEKLKTILSKKLNVTIRQKE